MFEIYVKLFLQQQNTIQIRARVLTSSQTSNIERKYHLLKLITDMKCRNIPQSVGIFIFSSTHGANIHFPGPWRLQICCKSLSTGSEQTQLHFCCCFLFMFDLDLERLFGLCSCLEILSMCNLNCTFYVRTAFICSNENWVR